MRSVMTAASPGASVTRATPPATRPSVAAKPGQRPSGRTLRRGDRDGLRRGRAVDEEHPPLRHAAIDLPRVELGGARDGERPQPARALRELAGALAAGAL